MSRRTISTIGSVVAVVVVLALFAWGRGGDPVDRSPSSGPGSASSSASSSPTSTDPDSGLPWVDERHLPPEARDTLELIDAGGPFRYPDKDGSTFGNFEGRLPAEPRGYYAEYTVPTPGSDDRGARRIITGDGGEYYLTADHYESFGRVRR